MPYYTAEGFTFTVLDADPINGDDVIGRCHINPEQARRLMLLEQQNDDKNKSSSPPLLLSLGDGIGVLKVKIQKATAVSDNANDSSSSRSLDEL